MKYFLSQENNLHYVPLCISYAQEQMQDLSQHPAMNRCQPCIKQPAAQSIASCLQSSDLVTLLKPIRLLTILLLVFYCYWYSATPSTETSWTKGPIVLPGGLGGVLQPTTTYGGSGGIQLSHLQFGSIKSL